MMKKICVCVFGVVLVLGLYSPGFGFLGKKVKGYFVTKEGRTQVFSELLPSPGLGYDKQQFSVKYDGNMVEVPLTEIKSILFLDNQLYLLKKRNGKDFKVECHAGDDFNISFMYYDTVNEETTKGVLKWGQIKQVVFDEDFGELRMCIKCGRTFPPDYVFCPYDKSELKLVNIK